jgi:GTP cyclohydrolase I
MSAFETDYAEGGERAEPVVLAALPFYSMCVHHVVPFFGTIDVGYVPDEKMTGFGSVGRVIDHFARRPQVQERLVNQIASHIDDELDPRGVLVRCRARQMCMEMRGSEKTGTLIATAARGVLTDETRRARLLETFAREQETP